jgi:hypothetical protein
MVTSASEGTRRVGTSGTGKVTIMGIHRALVNIVCSVNLQKCFTWFRVRNSCCHHPQAGNQMSNCNDRGETCGKSDLEISAWIVTEEFLQNFAHTDGANDFTHVQHPECPRNCRARVAPKKIKVSILNYDDWT